MQWLKREHPLKEKMLPTDWLGDKGAELVAQALESLLDDIAHNPQHRMREAFDAAVQRLIVRLQTDPDYAERAEQVRHYLLHDEKLAAYLRDLWSRMRQRLAADLDNPKSHIARKLAGMGRWLGQSLGIPLQMPAQHPFNPLPLLRLALAHGRNGSINRFVAQAVMQHAWVGGLDANAPERLQVLRELLLEQKHAEEAGEEVKQWLRSNTDQAKQAGVFGVPAWEVDGKVFWGQDALPMLRSYLQGDSWFDAHWSALESIPSSLKA